jgi:rRNA maturation endonuclease Nob1
MKTGVRHLLDRAIADGIEPKRRRRPCGGTFRNGPSKKFARCDRCGVVDYEKYEGDRHGS